MFTSLKTIWTRLRTADVIDWMFGALFLAVGLSIGALVFAAISSHPTPFGAISFVAPVVVEDENGGVPTAPAGSVFESLPAPAVAWNAAVPLKVSRIIDCAAHDCPKGGIPISVDVKWQEVSMNGAPAGKSFTQLTDYETVYEEGTDYARGTITAVSTYLPYIEVPEEVQAFIARGDKTVSAWRIEGYVTPELPNASVSTWVTDVIHIYIPETD